MVQQASNIITKLDVTTPRVLVASDLRIDAPMYIPKPTISSTIGNNRTSSDPCYDTNNHSKDADSTSNSGGNNMRNKNDTIKQYNSKRNNRNNDNNIVNYRGTPNNRKKNQNYHSKNPNRKDTLLSNKESDRILSQHHDKLSNEGIPSKDSLTTSTSKTTDLSSSSSLGTIHRSETSTTISSVDNTSVNFSSRNRTHLVQKQRNRKTKLDDSIVPDRYQQNSNNPSTGRGRFQQQRQTNSDDDRTNSSKNNLLSQSSSTQSPMGSSEGIQDSELKRRHRNRQRNTSTTTNRIRRRPNDPKSSKNTYEKGQVSTSQNYHPQDTTKYAATYDYEFPTSNDEISFPSLQQSSSKQDSQHADNLSSQHHNNTITTNSWLQVVKDGDQNKPENLHNKILQPPPTQSFDTMIQSSSTDFVLLRIQKKVERTQGSGTDINDSSLNDGTTIPSSLQSMDEQQNTSTNTEIETVIQQNDPSSSPQVTIINPQPTGGFIRRKNVNLNRLRDRWWDLLQKHYVETIKAVEATKVEPNSIQDEDGSSSNQQKQLVTNYSPLLLIPNGSIESTTFSADHNKIDKTDVATTTTESTTKQEISPILGPSVSQFCNPLKDAILQNNTEMLKCNLERITTKQELLKLLTLVNNKGDSEVTSGRTNMPVIQLAIHLNRSNLLTTLLQSLRRYNIDWCSIPYDDKNTKSPILIASERGYDECIDILFNALYNTPDSMVLTIKDDNGDTPFHYASRSSVPLSTFQLLYGYAAKVSGKGNSSSLFVHRLLAIKNQSSMQQTPIHIACANNRVDIIDFLLNKVRQISTLSKLLAIQDSYEQTPLLTAIAASSIDIVMSLLMWRGNNSLHQRFRYIETASNSINKPSVKTTVSAKQTSFSNNAVSSSSLTSTSTAPCPLKWAVTRSNNINMVMLLLEFNNPDSDHGYSINNALVAAVEMRLTNFGKRYNATGNDGSELMETIRILVEAGGNPCSVPETPQTGALLATSSTGVSSVIITVVKAGDCDCLTLLLDTYQQRLENSQRRRRQDPKLQKQPESFFTNMEIPETNELTCTMRDALVVSLFQYWQSFTTGPSKTSSSSAFLSCCIVLYQRNTSLTGLDIERIKNSVLKSELQPMQNDVNGVPINPEFVATQERVYEDIKQESCIEAVQHASSIAMLNLSWCPLSHSQHGANNYTGCDWIEQNYYQSDIYNKPKSRPSYSFGAPDVILTSSEGSQFHVHSAIISENSQKLAAAIRFASLSSHNFHSQETNNNDSSEHTMVSVNIPSKQLRRILEHIYHGSIVVGRFSQRNAKDYYENLLELLLLADEYICPSLLQECEMRLLATDYRRCLCWYCNNNSTTNTVLLTPDNNKYNVKRSYSVSGPTVLIQPEDALEVLVVTQQLGFGNVYVDDDLTLRNDVRFSITENIGILDAGTNNTTSNKSDITTTMQQTTTSSIHRRPLEVLREVAVVTILQNLGPLMDNEQFLMSVRHLINTCDQGSGDDNNDEDNSTPPEQEILFGYLLEILLCELSNLGIIRQ